MCGDVELAATTIGIDGLVAIVRYCRRFVSVWQVELQEQRASRNGRCQIRRGDVGEVWEARNEVDMP